MVKGRAGVATVALALGLAIPLAVGAGLAVVTLMRSPLDSNTPQEPIIATVGRAERLVTQTATVSWVPASTQVVRTQATGTITQLSLTVGAPLTSGDTVMSVDGAPVVAYVAPAPLYRDIGAGMSGDDVTTAQRLLVTEGYLSRADGKVGQATTRAILEFNKAHGRGDSSTLTVSSLQWVPEGSGAPQEVHVHVGDVIGPQGDLYTTATSGDQIVVTTTAADTDRTLTVGGAKVPLPATVTHITVPTDVTAVREAMAGEPTATATVAATVARQVGTVPASAVVIDDDGTACFFPGVDGNPIQIAAEQGSFGLVDVDPELVGTPVLADPRHTRTDLSCA